MTSGGKARRREFQANRKSLPIAPKMIVTTARPACFSDADSACSSKVGSQACAENGVRWFSKRCQKSDEIVVGLRLTRLAGGRPVGVAGYAREGGEGAFTLLMVVLD